MVKIRIEPKVKGYICTTAHPLGCAARVGEEVNFLSRCPPIKGPKSVLVIGASTGYGLASRMVAAFSCGAHSCGVFFERPAQGERPASAGWYNTAALEARIRSRGLRACHVNGDAFSDEIKEKTVERIRGMPGGKVDLVIYSLASPRRTHPRTGEVLKSVLRPIGVDFTGKTVNTDQGTVHEVTLGAALEEEIRGTVGVMGGEDWYLWMEKLKAGGVLADGIRTVSYSYVGPRLTRPIYGDGTIGRAKAHMESMVPVIRELLKPLEGRAWVAVNKAVVTQASAAIPVVPLYISTLFFAMKKRNLHENCWQQIHRLFGERLYTPGHSIPPADDRGRLRVDDWEMGDDVQREVESLWPQINTENLRVLTDFDGYRREFLQLFGFAVDGVDYERETETVWELED